MKFPYQMLRYYHDIFPMQKLSIPITMLWDCNCMKHSRARTENIGTYIQSWQNR